MNIRALKILLIITFFLGNNTCFSSEKNGLFGDFVCSSAEVGSNKYNEKLCGRLSVYGNRSKIVDKVLSEYPFDKDAVYVAYGQFDCFISWHWYDEKYYWDYKISLYFAKTGELEKCYSSCKKTVRESSPLPDGRVEQ